MHWYRLCEDDCSHQGEVIILVCLALTRSGLKYHGWFEAPSLRDAERPGRVQGLGAGARDNRRRGGGSCFHLIWRGEGSRGFQMLSQPALVGCYQREWRCPVKGKDAVGMRDVACKGNSSAQQAQLSTGVGCPKRLCISISRGIKLQWLRSLVARPCFEIGS